MTTKTPQLGTQLTPSRTAPIRTQTAEVVEAGAIAGLIGGIAMVLVATLYAAFAGLGFFSPIRAIATTLVGTSTAAEMGDPAVIVLGVLVHLMVSMVFGVIFAALMPARVQAAPALALGLFAGVSILVLMSLVVLPLVNPVARAQLMWGSSPGAIPVAVAFAMHLVYGAGLSVAPMLRRSLSTSARGRRALAS